MLNRLANELAVFALAVQFLTRIPVRAESIYTAERMATGPRYFPLVGLAVGALVGLAFVVFAIFFPVDVAVVLCIAVGVMLTGAFHEDGLADTMDALGTGQSVERMLEIMRDSRLGTYGTVSLLLVIVLKVVSLASIAAEFIVPVIILSHCVSRLSAVWFIRTSHYVRASGAGKPTAEGISNISLMIATFTGFVALVSFAILTSFVDAFGIAVATTVTHATTRLYIVRKLGGYTGDTLGAMQQVSELAVYLACLALL